MAFNYGAFHTLFFTRQHQVAVVLCVVVLGTIVLRRQVHVSWWLVALISIPMVLVFFRFVFPARTPGSTASRVDGVLVVLVIMLIPVVFWIVLRLIAPDYFSIPNRRLKVASSIIVLLIVLMGYGVGELNGRFLTCQKFEVSGNDVPADCADGD